MIYGWMSFGPFERDYFDPLGWIDPDGCAHDGDPDKAMANYQNRTEAQHQAVRERVRALRASMPLFMPPQEI